MQQRYYDPQVGRFLSNDPMPTNPNSGGNFSRYWYANDNPFRFIDPDGRLAKGTYQGTDPNKKTAEERRREQAARLRETDAPHMSGGAMANADPGLVNAIGTAAEVTSIGFDGLEKGAKAVAKASPTLPSSAVLAGEFVGATRAAGNTLSGVSVLTSAHEALTSKTIEGQAHGKVGVLVGIAGFAFRGPAVAYAVADYGVQRTFSYTSPSDGRYYEGWSAAVLSLPPIDLGSQPYPGNH